MLASFYPALLALHSWLRWLVLLTALIAIFMALAGWLGKKPAGPGLRRASLFFVSSMDLQFLLGLALYFFVSPITRAALANFGAAMKAPESRFFAVEHSTLMLLAVICAHLGAIRARKAPSDLQKFRGAAIAYLISLFLLLAGIPWWRPLFRF